jgi:uncharacterized protein YaiL (DUF2058 family)
MTISLRDQLMQLGFKAPEPPVRNERGPKARPAVEARPKPGRGVRGKAGGARDGSPHPASAGSEEMDLAKAYALRQRQEREQQQRLERERQAESARRREARHQLHTLMQSASLNQASAELPRHFEHGGKIRRIYVNAEQLRSLNSGELAVVAAGGRYHLVSLADAEAAAAILPECLALQVDPSAGKADDDYADPRFAVPDDLVW